MGTGRCVVRLNDSVGDSMKMRNYGAGKRHFQTYDLADLENLPCAE